MEYSASLATQYGLGLATPPVQYPPAQEPRPQPPPGPAISAQKYAPDAGYQTASGYYAPSASYPVQVFDSRTGTLVDIWV